MGIYLSDQELALLCGESHALVTLYSLAIRPRMNYETGKVGESPRISYRALCEWCYIEPNPRGGTPPEQLSIQQIRRLVERLVKIGLIIKTTITDPATRREYIELFCTKASLKGQIQAKTTPVPALKGNSPLVPASRPRLPKTRPGACTNVALPACRFDRISQQRIGRASVKNEIYPRMHQCVQIAPDRGIDRQKPSNGAGLQVLPDRGSDTHQSSFKSKQLLPPAPFIADKNDSVGSGDFVDPGSTPPTTTTSTPTAPYKDEEMNTPPAPLIWPICIHDSQKLSLLCHLSLSPQPQALLDELAGADQARVIRTSPVGYLLGLIKREKAGTFIPERGIGILETRRANARHTAQARQREAIVREPTKPIPANSALGKLLATLPVPKQAQEGTQ